MAYPYEHNPLQVRVDDLGDKWTTDEPDHPICAACGRTIGSYMHDVDCQVSAHGHPYEDDPWARCTCGANDLPFMVWRDRGPRREYLYLHVDCAEQRVVGKP